ncbi:hypothetical protein OIO90_001728 [Microbotryomycetes sp. JL221]|nr:hypothetical protein OIO90_001728 [Microbotryomycetes sp. JL221]
MDAANLSPTGGGAVQLANGKVRDGRSRSQLCPLQSQLQHTNGAEQLQGLSKHSSGPVNGVQSSNTSVEMTSSFRHSESITNRTTLAAREASQNPQRLSSGSETLSHLSETSSIALDPSWNPGAVPPARHNLNAWNSRSTSLRQPHISNGMYLGASTSSSGGMTSDSSLRTNSLPSTPQRPVSNTSATADNAYPADLEPTAALIQQLYAKLDLHGVSGDGWSEGTERSRDGLINRLQLNESVSAEAGEDARAESKAQENRVLERLDRYGFFSSTHPAALSSQHHRIAKLDAAAYSSLAGSKKKKRSRPMSLQTPPSTSTSSQQKIEFRVSVASQPPKVAAVETKRIDKWADMLTVFRRDPGGNVAEWGLHDEWWNGRETRGVDGGKYRKLQRRVFKGVPDRWRRAVWAVEMEKTAKEGQGKSRRVATLVQLEKEYWALIEKPSAQDIQIDLDVPRTISGHVMFHTRYGQGQRALFHVLHAAGLRCLDIGGYCQGMGPIAATLLCYFEPEYRLRDIFAPGFPGLVENFYVQERLVEFLMPDVHKAFEIHGITSSSYATKWYITLFANSVPFATQLRFWDALLLEGMDFLIVAAVAIIWCFRDQFTSLDASFEDILSALSSFFEVESDDALMRWIRKALRMKGLRQRLREWRAEWRNSAKALIT